MPVLEVLEGQERHRLQALHGTGYAGIENPLFFKENTRMLFGDAKADAGGTPLAGLVNATLGTLDELVAGLSDLDVRLIRGTAAGLTQSQLAAAEGITQSAVSQRLARNGSWALLAALRALWAPESAS
jgi:hypothetical protein